MKFLAEGCTDKGSFRKNNQDSICIMEADTEIGHAIMLIVCDGMGGLAKGEVASGSVVMSFVDWFEQEFPNCVNYSMQQLCSIWVQMIEENSQKLKNYGASRNITLGTTFSGMLIINQEYMWVHVGDSRIYCFNDEYAVQITSDHTVVARELAKGTITAEEAINSNKKNKLTQCVGASAYLQPEYNFGTIKKGEQFLLCSDGFYHKLTKTELSKTYWSKAKTNKKLQQMLRQTVQDIIKRGEKDNVSVIMVKV